LSSKEGSKVTMEKTLSKIVYYFVVIFVVIIVLGKLNIPNVLAPLETMLNDFFSAIPNIIKAGIIAFIGYTIANLASELVELISQSVNRLSAKLGFDVTQFNLIKILKQIVFLIVFIPMLIVAIDELGMEALSGPATAMLQKFMNAIPNIIGAGIILGVFYLLAKFIAPALRELLRNLKVDELPARMGLKFLEGRSISGMAGSLVFFFIMLSGLIEALDMLEMATVVEAVQEVMHISGRIFFGLLVLVLGNFVANIAYNSLANGDNSGMAAIARIAILGIFFGIGLNAMGIANSIVNLAFGLTLGAVAVAVALSFGLGGREAAGKQMDHILSKFRKN